MEHPEIIPHLFRTEFGRITSVLSKVLGIAHLEIAEDIVSETFTAALETLLLYCFLLFGSKK